MPAGAPSSGSGRRGTGAVRGSCCGRRWPAASLPGGPGSTSAAASTRARSRWSRRISLASRGRPRRARSRWCSRRPIATRPRGSAASLPSSICRTCSFRSRTPPARKGTLAAALEMTRTMPAPLTIIWRPAFQRLAAEGRARGCSVVLAGDGADEWLWENPISAADMLAIARSRWSAPTVRRSTLAPITFRAGRHFASWCGITPPNRCWRIAYYAAAIRVGARRWRDSAGGRLRSRRSLPRHGSRRMRPCAPRWWSVSRQPTSRDARAATGQLLPARHPSATRFSREVPARGGDVPARAACWHPDSGAVLGSRPDRASGARAPGARSAGGLAKALERRPLSKRFPELEFDRQRKSWIGGAVLSVLTMQTGAARQALGGFPTLVDLGVIDGEQVRVLIDDALRGKESTRATPMGVGTAQSGGVDAGKRLTRLLAVRRFAVAGAPNRFWRAPGRSRTYRSIRTCRRRSLRVGSERRSTRSGDRREVGRGSGRARRPR